MISVIIPSHNENPHDLQRCVELLKHDAVKDIIIVESGIAPLQNEFLRDNGKVRSIISKKSRALQMNAGANETSGELLLFIHADSVIDHGGIDEALRVIKDKRVSAVSFNLKFESGRLAFRFIEFGVRARNFFLNIPYGDQGYLVCKKTFIELNGFDNVAILEDVMFVKKLKSRGRVKIVPASVTTSSRRYEREGVFRTIIRNFIIMTLYFLRLAPENIAKIIKR